MPGSPLAQARSAETGSSSQNTQPRQVRGRSSSVSRVRLTIRRDIADPLGKVVGYTDLSTLLAVVILLQRNRPLSQACVAVRFTPARRRAGTRYDRDPPKTEVRGMSGGTTLDDYTGRYAQRVSGMTASEIRALFAVANRPEVV